MYYLNPSRKVRTMKTIFEDDTATARNALYRAFELDADEASTESTRPVTTPSMEHPADFRVWRCNGVSIGVRFNK